MLNATMRHFTFDETELVDVRRELYSPKGSGYVLVRGFALPDLAAHMQRFWTVDNIEMFREFEVFRNRPVYEVGSGPFATHYKSKKDVYYFPLWSRPPDEVTLSAAVAIIQLRNQIEQRPIFRDLLPCSPRMAFYMILRSLRTDEEQLDVRWHTDEFPHDEHHPYVETRLQCTLFLSTYGVDYHGSGLCMKSNLGDELQIDRELGTRCGDLLIWRYANAHCVGAIKSDGRVGFTRVIFPPEPIKLSRSATTPEPAKQAAEPAPVSPPPAPAKAPVAYSTSALKRLLGRVRRSLFSPRR